MGKFSQALHKAKIESLPAEALPTMDLIRRALAASNDPHVKEVCKRLVDKIARLNRLREALRKVYAYAKGPIQ